MRRRHPAGTALASVARLRATAGLVVAIAALSACGGSTRSSVAPPPTKLPSTRPDSIYWGARIGNQLTGHAAPWSRQAIVAFNALVGKRVSIIHFESPFANCAVSPCAFYPFQSGPMTTIRKMGAIPFFTWGSQSTPSHFSEPDFTLAQVIDGTYDSYIRKFAEGAKRWGHPFFLRFDPSMNGDWAPWAANINGNTSSEVVLAWRHVHNIFTAVGARNVTWVGCPDAGPDDSAANLSALYPGNAYVNWTCLDGYNSGTNPSAATSWKTFDDIFSSSYQSIVDHVAPSKPMIIGEVASSEHGGSKSTWIADMLRELPIRYPKIRGIIWSEYYYQGGDWPVETSAAAKNAFAAGIASSAYVSNRFAKLPPGPIGPPSDRR